MSSSVRRGLPYINAALLFLSCILVCSFVSKFFPFESVVNGLQLALPLAIGLISLLIPDIRNGIQKSLQYKATALSLTAVCVVFGLLVFIPLNSQSRSKSDWRLQRENQPETKLEDGDKIASGENLVVSHPPLTSGKLWVVLQQPNGFYYPLTRNIDTASCGVTPTASVANGSVVRGPENVGEAEDGMKSFNILLIQADDASDAAFRAVLRKWCLAKDYPGLQSLPQGSDVKEEIKLKRR